MNVLPSGYKVRKHYVTDGIARSGEVSPKGTVTHAEDWEGRVSAHVLPGTQRWLWDGRRLRQMTFKEMVERGYFILGKGPVGHREFKDRTETR